MEENMTNKKIWLGFAILVFIFVVTSCDLFEDAFSVPKWARGTWHLNDGSGALNKIKAVEITSTEFIPADGLKNSPGIGTYMTKKKVTVSTDNSVVFDLIEVKKTSKSTEITVGVTGMSQITPVTLYK